MTKLEENRSPSWPENRRAPGRLELARRLLNTSHLEADLDLLVSRAGTSRWVTSEGFASGGRITQRQTEALREFRNRLRNSIDNPTVAPTETTDWIFGPSHRSVQFVLVDDVPMLEGADDDSVARYITTIGLVIGEALRDGIWDRFRTCANPACRWAFYDNSKNGSGRWCSMDICGARNKMNTYRARAD